MKSSRGRRVISKHSFIKNFRDTTCVWCVISIFYENSFLTPFNLLHSNDVTPSRKSVSVGKRKVRFDLCLCFLVKHLLRYCPIFARSSTLHFADAVHKRQKITVHIKQLVSSEFPNRSSRSTRSFISTLKTVLKKTRGHYYKIKHFSTEFEYFAQKLQIFDLIHLGMIAYIFN